MLCTRSASRMVEDMDGAHAMVAKDSTEPKNPIRLEWYVSTYTGGQGNCVQVADLPAGRRAVRDSKHPDGGFLLFSPEEWKAFVGSARDGEL